MPLTFKQEEQREAAASQQEEQSVALLGQGAIPKKRKTTAKKPEHRIAEALEETNQQPFLTKAFVISKVSKASQKCEQLTTWNFQDIGFFLAGTVFIFCIFALVRNVAFSDCPQIQQTEIIQMPRMDEKVLNDFIFEGVEKMVGNGLNFFDAQNPATAKNFRFDLQHPTVTNFMDSLRFFKQELLEFSEKVGSIKTKITFIE